MLATAFGGVTLKKKLSRILEEKTDFSGCEVMQDLEVALARKVGLSEKEEFSKPMPASAPRHSPRSSREPLNQGLFDGIHCTLETRGMGHRSWGKDASTGVTAKSADFN